MSRLIPHDQYKRSVFAQMYGSGPQSFQQALSRLHRFEKAPKMYQQEVPVRKLVSVGDEFAPMAAVVRARPHDGRHRTKQDIEESLTELQTTVLAAARMGGIHRVYYHFKTSPKSARVLTAFHLGHPRGQDVTIQILALGRRGLLEGVTYKTWDEID